jgi:predicted DNA-binding transcriptional regulator YafY
MADTSSRMLRLLSLLQNCRDWSGPMLAERLDVSPRTLRRDIDRLRELGYPVRAISGVRGGYRLEAGAALPPLLLDDEEAVAIAVGLRTAVGGTVAGIEETSVRALAKLEQLLPGHLRRRVNAVQTYTVPFIASGPIVDPGHLAMIAQACRDHEQLRFSYCKRDGIGSNRIVEPYRLVYVIRKWYLMAWDLDREDWRTFRVDRLKSPLATGLRFKPRELPAADAAAYVAQAITSSLARYRALVTLHAPVEVIAERIRPTDGVLESVDDQTCRLRTAADSLQWLALTIGMFDIEFEIHEPPELIDYVRRLAERLSRSAIHDTTIVTGDDTADAVTAPARG